LFNDYVFNLPSSTYLYILNTIVLGATPFTSADKLNFGRRLSKCTAKHSKRHQRGIRSFTICAIL